MGYQIEKAIVDAVMKDVGLSNEGTTGLAESHSQVLTPKEAND